MESLAKKITLFSLCQKCPVSKWQNWFLLFSSHGESLIYNAVPGLGKQGQLKG